MTAARNVSGYAALAFAIQGIEVARGALDEAARRMRRKPSEVVRLALEAYLQSPPPRDLPASRVRHLLGSLESGTPDLAERHREYVLQSLRDDR